MSHDFARHLDVLSAALEPVDDETVAVVRAARQLLAEMELLAHGGVTAWNSSGRGKAGSKPPSGESRPPHVEWRERFDGAAVGEWPALLEEARGELDGWRRRTQPADASISTAELVVMEGGKGWTAEDVGHKFGVPGAYVRRMWVKAGRNADTGAANIGGNRTTEALFWDSFDLSQQEIAARMGVHQSSVSRLLKTVRPGRVA